MTDLRHPDLRIRDLRRIVFLKMDSVKWDPGIEAKNEWIYASIESDLQKRQLLCWLSSKGINRNYDCVFFDQAWCQLKQIHWGDLLDKPEDFFSGPSFEVASFDLAWVLGYNKNGIARFGRWTEKADTDLRATPAALGG